MFNKIAQRWPRVHAWFLKHLHYDRIFALREGTPAALQQLRHRCGLAKSALRVRKMHYRPQGEQLECRQMLSTVGFSTGTVLESASSATAMVVLSSAQVATVTVDYASADSTAHSGTDYTAVSGTLSFAPGTTSLTVSVPLLNYPEAGNKLFNITLSNAVNITLGTITTYAVTITEPPPIKFSASTYAVNDNAGTATITASIASTWGQAITANYAANERGTTKIFCDVILLAKRGTLAYPWFPCPVPREPLLAISATMC